MSALKRLVAEGRYEVDSRLVADALIARVFGGPLAGFAAWSQNECSKPASGPSQSTNLASG